MEHQNKKPILPGFPSTSFTAQFPALQTNTTNALMSTLHSLQMHNLGNSIIPPTNMTPAEFSQRVLFEQMKAMQTMYSLSLKPETTNTAGSSTTYDKNGTAAAKLAATTIFPTHFLAAGDLQTLAASAMIDKSDSVPSTSATNDISQIDAATLGNLLHPKAVHGLNFNAMNGLAAGMFPTDDWMKSVQLDTFAEKNSDIQIARPTPINAIPSTSQTSVINNTQSVTSTSTPAATKESVEVPKEDDLEEMFGLSNLDDGVEAGPTDMNGGLSPVQFTPPDSPTEALTTDFLFGLEPARTNSTPASCSSQPSTSAAPALNNKEDQSSDGFKVPEVPVIESSSITPPPIKEPIYARKFVKSNKIPVYKQKLNSIYSSEKKESKDDFDAFEFDDDDIEDTLKPQEIKEKEIDIYAQCDAKSKNVYVPGIGFAISHEPPPPQDLWRHVVPKKRHHGENNKALPGSNLLPSSALHEAQLAARLVDPAIVTLAESIRFRRNQRISCNFLKPVLSNDTDCPKTKVILKLKRNEPVIPKMIIKISRVLETLENGATRKKKKKKGSDEEDEIEDDDEDDWDFAASLKRRRRTSKKIYELRTVDPEEAAEKEIEYDYHHGLGISKHTGRKENTDSVKHRLSKFGSAEGFLPKGTYVVCKADLLKDDCALWRVDNQNLLQKFPPRVDLIANKLIYKSSSTYSGWCEQISNQYFRVSVKVIKQNRSETTIEPEIPLSELFPAMSEEMLKNPRTVYNQEPPKPFDETILNRDNQRIAMHTLMVTLLNHALTMDYLQQVQEKSDWTYTRSVTEIEQANTESVARIRKRVYITEYIDVLIDQYTRLIALSSDFYDLTQCQICGRRKTKMVLQFYDRKSYDSDTLQFNLEEFEEFPEDILPSLDVYACKKCGTATNYLHRIKHLRLHLLRQCEEKLELVGTEHIEIAPERIVEIVKKDKPWIAGVIATYCEMWRQIKLDFE